MTNISAARDRDYPLARGPLIASGDIRALAGEKLFETMTLSLSAQQLHRPHAQLFRQMLNRSQAEVAFALLD